MTEEFILSATRAQQDGRDTIRTHTGRYVRPLAMNFDDIILEDIVHHLSNICRYTGACPGFYSVAQHSVMVMKHVRRRHPHDLQLQRLALLHDAPEAYINDMASPVKHTPQFKFYRDIDDSLSFRVAQKLLGLDLNSFEYLWKRVKMADDATFHRETRVFYGKKKPGDFFVRLPPFLAKLYLKFWVWRLGIK